MKPILKQSIVITALSSAGFVLAAGDPPTPTVDLGAMKLKSQPSAPAKVANGPAPAPAVVPKPAGTPVVAAPAGIGANAPAQNVGQNTATPANTPSPAQSPLATTIKTPIGIGKAIDILGTPAANTQTPAAQDPNAVTVKMPSMYRK